MKAYTHSHPLTLLTPLTPLTPLTLLSVCLICAHLVSRSSLVRLSRLCPSRLVSSVPISSLVHLSFVSSRLCPSRLSFVSRSSVLSVSISSLVRLSFVCLVCVHLVSSHLCPSRLVSSVSISSLVRLSFVCLICVHLVSRSSLVRLSRLCPSRLVCVHLVSSLVSSLVRLSSSLVRPSRLVCVHSFKRVKPVNSFKARRYSKCLNRLESMGRLKGFEVFGDSHNSNAVHIDRWTI